MRIPFGAASGRRFPVSRCSLNETSCPQRYAIAQYAHVAAAGLELTAAGRHGCPRPRRSSTMTTRTADTPRVVIWAVGSADRQNPRAFGAPPVPLGWSHWGATPFRTVEALVSG